MSAVYGFPAITSSARSLIRCPQTALADSNTPGRRHRRRRALVGGVVIAWQAGGQLVVARQIPVANAVAAVGSVPSVVAVETMDSAAATESEEEWRLGYF